MNSFLFYDSSDKTASICWAYVHPAMTSDNSAGKVQSVCRSSDYITVKKWNLSPIINKTYLTHKRVEQFVAIRIHISL